MTPERGGPPTDEQSRLASEVGAKAARRLHAQAHPADGVWFGLGMMGLIGWSVVVPTLLGVGLGLWLDQHHPGNHTWTLSLMAAGLVIGCANAWHWVSNEDKAMRNASGASDA